MSNDTTTTTTYAAGFYPDAQTPGQERFYDGHQWTDEVRPAAAAPVEPPAPVKSKRKGWIIGGSIAAAVLLIGGIGAAAGAGSDDESVAENRPAVTQPVEQVADTRVEVPDLVGGTVAEARASLEALGLVLIAPDGTADDAIVQTQTLSTGSAAEPGTEVSVTAAAPAPVLTMGQQQAVAKAESYLRFTAFSRSGLIDQLVFEDYSAEDATFAVDFIEADWNEQAAAKAQSYLDFTSFSRQGLIDQLVFEGFTQAEAEYGAAAVGY